MANKDFKCPVAYQVNSRIGWEVMVKGLQELGYKIGSEYREWNPKAPYICTNYLRRSNVIVAHETKLGALDSNRKLVDNADAFFAIAGITNEVDFQIGEPVVATRTSGTQSPLDYKEGNIYIVTRATKSNITTIDRNGETNGWSKDYFRKATEEEIIRYYQPPIKPKQMKNIVIEGISSLKRAFCEELNALGFQPLGPSTITSLDKDNMNVNIQTSDFEKKVYMAANPTTTSNNDIYKLPRDWDAALNAVKNVLNSLQPKEIKLTLGNNAVEVTVTKDSIRAREAEFNYQSIKNLYESLKKISSNLRSQNVKLSGNYSAYIDEEQQFIRIGCVMENNLFSLIDLKKVMDSYETLNK